MGENPELSKSGGTDSSNTVDGNLVRSPLEAARDAYRKARDDIIKGHDLVLEISWPETSRIAEWRIVAHAQTLGKADRFIGGHIPEVKFGRDFDRYSTQPIRELLKLRGDEQVGTRTLCLVVMKRLRPMHGLDNSFGTPFGRALRVPASPCDYTAPTNTNHHGDISLGNLGYDVSPAGKPEGVLNDYDLPGTNSQPRTTTEPVPSPSCHSRCSVADLRSEFLGCTGTTQSRSCGCSPIPPSSTWSTGVALSRSLGQSSSNPGSRGTKRSTIRQSNPSPATTVANSRSLSLTSDTSQQFEV